jgi:Putative DNA-binding domain
VRLIELQRALQGHVLRGDRAIAGLVRGTKIFDTDTRLAVYRDGYAQRLAEALAHTYPALREAIGPAAFGGCIERLAHHSPSRHYSVRDYGGTLAAQLERELAGARARGAADLARFEWAIAGAFDAPDSSPVTLNALQSVPARDWPRLRFSVAPSVQRVELASNAVLWWKAACEGKPRPTRWRRQQRSSWLVWRRDLAVYFRPLGEDEPAALARLVRGARFSQLCAGLAAVLGKEPAPMRAAALLRGWIEEGLIADYRVEGPRARR